jgi:hypothetical protein
MSSESFKDAALARLMVIYKLLAAPPFLELKARAFLGRFRARL